MHLFPAGHVEKVVSLFERYDPAIEQIGHGAALPAKVVDDERPAVTFELQRSLTNFGVRILRDLQLVERQFSADDDRGSDNSHPARINPGEIEEFARRFGRHLFVHARVEEADDLAFDAECSWNENRSAETTGDPFSDAGLAITRLAVQEHPATRVDRRAERVEHLLVDNQVAERLVQLVNVNGLFGDALGCHPFEVIFQRDRSRAEVRTLRRKLARS